MTNQERAAFKLGIKIAADCANHYNSSTTHPYKLGDCILAKLNQLPKGKIKKNKDRIKAK